jgi:ribonuclease R
VAALHDFLEGLDIEGARLAKGQVVRPRHFNQLLERVTDTPYGPVINQLVLRSQSQAVYAPENAGHFGLALRRYAHFTSPIRRYSDLLVHRALVAANGFGEGGLEPVDPKEFAETGEHISMTERRAAAAERDAVERYTVAFLAERRGAEFAGRINGVQRFGVFVTLDETGADGLVPIGKLPSDFYKHEEKQQRLVGQRWGRSFGMGDPVTVRLLEADTTTGSLVFEIIESEEESAVGPTPAKGGRQARLLKPARGQRTARRRSRQRR